MHQRRVTVPDTLPLLMHHQARHLPVPCLHISCLGLAAGRRAGRAHHTEVHREPTVFPMAGIVETRPGPVCNRRMLLRAVPSCLCLLCVRCGHYGWAGLVPGSVVNGGGGPFYCSVCCCSRSSVKIRWCMVNSIAASQMSMHVSQLIHQALSRQHRYTELQKT